MPFDGTNYQPSKLLALALLVRKRLKNGWLRGSLIRHKPLSQRKEGVWPYNVCIMGAITLEEDGQQKGRLRPEQTELSTIFLQKIKAYRVMTSKTTRSMQFASIPQFNDAYCIKHKDVMTVADSVVKHIERVEAKAAVR